LTRVDVANYKIAYTLSSITIPIGAIFSFIYLSKITDYKNDINLFKKTFRNQLLLMLVLGITLIIGIIFFFPFMNKILFSNTLKNSYLPSIILSIASLFNLLSMSCTYTLLTLNKDKSIFIVTIIGSVFYLLTCYMLIPDFGIIGVSIIMLFSYLLLFATYYILIKKNIKKLINN
jgi:O-antigen/teichoic acid export membrane protein